VRSVVVAEPDEPVSFRLAVGAEVRTVLVLDDESSIRLLCRVNLELEGYRVLEATTLDEGRRILGSERVDVLLIDIHVGPEDGRKLVRELRESKAPTGIALLTGTVDLSTAERAGADAVLEKPFRLEVLVDTVRRLESRIDSATK
jgi:DNA-binding response OmpR family regulator